VINDPLLPPETLNPDISPNIAYIICQAMQLDPERRPLSISIIEETIKATKSDDPSKSASQFITPQTNQLLSTSGQGTIVLPKHLTQPKFNKWMQWMIGVLIFVSLSVVILFVWNFDRPGGILHSKEDFSQKETQTEQMASLLETPVLTAIIDSSPITIINNEGTTTPSFLANPTEEVPISATPTPTFEFERYYRFRGSMDSSILVDLPGNAPCKATLKNIYMAEPSYNRIYIKTFDKHLCWLQVNENHNCEFVSSNIDQHTVEIRIAEDSVVDLVIECATSP
jgi:hypothetical protein